MILDAALDLAAQVTPGPRCVDCRIELMPDTPLGSRDWQRYMVHDHVWADADMAGGWLCVECLESRLGRRLTGADLPPLPINEPGRMCDDTDRLAELKRVASVLWTALTS